MEYARPELLAEPDWLAAHAEDPDVRIIDCATIEAYRRAHIPGAVHLPVHYYLKEDGGRDGGIGALVMPPDDFAALMGKLGVGAGTKVIAYDDNNGMLAARMWWALNYHGHTAVQVLNGGWHRWLTEGHPVTFHGTKPEPAAFTPSLSPAVNASKDQVLSAIGDASCQILDVRTDAEWDGSNDRGNARTGHVPGAKHLEWVRFVERDDTRRILPADQIQALLDEVGFDGSKASITYCQGGVRAAHAAFVLALMGYDDVRVYDGSMFEWANLPDTPLE